MSEEKTVTACVLVIGNEILSGRTRDRNINYLAKGLNEIGIRLREVSDHPRCPGGHCCGGGRDQSRLRLRDHDRRYRADP